MAAGWLAFSLSIMCAIYGCAALSWPLAAVAPQPPVTPRLQADYSPWAPTTFSPLLDTLLLEAAKDLNLAGRDAGVPAEICLLPDAGCTDSSAVPLESGGCPASASAKCRPSAEDLRP